MVDWTESFEGRARSDAMDGQAARPLRGAALALVVIGALWFLAFITGLAPWLGYHTYDYRSGVVDRSEDSGVGATSMVLVRGQTAYIDYSVAGDPGRAIYLDVTPWPAILWSDRMLKVEVGNAGRVEFPVSETGFYKFRATPTPDSYRDTLRFEVSWGAR